MTVASVEGVEFGAEELKMHEREIERPDSGTCSIRKVTGVK